eukprot:CAMPEP_0185024250 /NCGR_PEP_ID=MMETSP1103-20130426/7249_1 /TAXON_ID=36769 /ORGANISM="Paraphysomonas bandaiensis, Strain Caron Lab Isolate" /LENGTH=220 /DNA_ID=CAMNT_0027557169 /DNA_START=177 /DNA_END=839 /DNA_ORIENTATION=+
MYLQSPNSTRVLTRSFRSTTTVLAKGGKRKPNNIDDGEEIALPSSKDTAEKMDGRLSYLSQEFSRIRGSKLTSDVFSHISVNAYGGSINMSEAGQLSIRGNTLTIHVYDPLLLKPVANAVRDCGMSLTPSVEGSAVVVSVPKPSAETRADMIKLVGKSGEKVKQEIRQIRKTTMNEIKKLKGKVSEDEIRVLMKEVDAVTEAKVEEVVQLVKTKEKDIMS